MLKRFKEYNVFFAVLMVISFTATFVSLYYGLNFYRQFILVRKNQEFYRYGEVCRYIVKHTDASITEKDILAEIKNRRISVGNLFTEVGLPVGEESNRPVNIDCLLYHNEPLLEIVNEGDIDEILHKVNEPACIIGDYWEKYTYIVEGKKYVKILGEPVAIIATFKQATIKNNDKRLYIIDETIDEAVKDKWYRYSKEGTIWYKNIDKADLQEEIQEIFENFYGKDSIKDVMIGVRADNRWNDAKKTFKNFTPIILTLIISVIGLSICNLIFIIFVWSRTHIYEYMVKRAFGYRLRQLVPEIGKQILVYESVGLVVMLVLTLFFEAAFGDVGIWVDNLANGVFIVIVLFIAVGFLLSLMPLVWISQTQPVSIINKEV